MAAFFYAFRWLKKRIYSDRVYSHAPSRILFAWFYYLISNNFN